MMRLMASRLLQLPLILAVVFGITFVLAWVVPGNPLERPEGQRPPPEVEAAMRRQFNLDSPWSFLGSYVRGVVRGDLGPSLKYPDQRVNDILASGLPVSVVIGLAALLVALHIGLAAGIAGALRPGSVWDLSSLGVAIIGVSLPTFVTGSVLLIVFAVVLQWAPVGGGGRPGTWCCRRSRWG